MNTRIILWLSILPILALLTACGGSQLESKIARLENEFQKGTSGSSVSFSSEEIQSLMQELAGAYEDFANANKDDERAPDYLYKAAEIYETNLDNSVKAVTLLEQVETQYPNSPRAADALFKMGFIYNNDEQMKDLNKAKSVYQEFVEKYPDHPLKKDAEFELKYLGLSDEELLKRIQSEGQEQDSTGDGSPS